MPPHKTATLTADQLRELKAASAKVSRAGAALDKAVEARHQLWRDLVAGGASQSEVARASGVIRQAVGWAITHPPSTGS